MRETAATDTIGKVSSIVARIAAQHDVPHVFAPTDHLVDSGLTSMAMVDLMLAIEADFDVIIPQREMKPTNFQSVASLTGMLERLNLAA